MGQKKCQNWILAKGQSFARPDGSRDDRVVLEAGTYTSVTDKVIE